VAGFQWEASLLFGTVLDDGDDLSSERVMAAAGHGAAVYYHFWFENGRSMEDLPRGMDWVAAYADIPADERHLAIHDRHLIAVNDRDRAFVTPEILQAMGATFRPAELRDRLAAMEAGGMTEIAYQPAGPDIPRELEAFAAAVHG
jgi:5,10-methylenetetrahydromethanopterin reductase